MATPCAGQWDAGWGVLMDWKEERNQCREKTVYIGSKASRSSKHKAKKAHPPDSAQRAGLACKPEKSRSSAKSGFVGPSEEVGKALAVYIGPKRSRSKSARAGKTASLEEADGPRNSCLDAPRNEVCLQTSGSSRAHDSMTARGLVAWRPSLRAIADRKSSQRRSASEGPAHCANTGIASLLGHASRRWIGKTWQVGKQSKEACCDKEGQQSGEISLRGGWRWGDPLPSSSSKVRRARSEGPAVCRGAIMPEKSSLAAAIHKMGLPTAPRCESWDWPLSREESAMRVKVLAQQVNAASW